MPLSSKIISLEGVQEFLEKEKAVALYFTTPRCSVCEVLKPKIEELIQAEFPLIKFIQIKSDISPDISGHFGVFTAPTFLVFFEGKEYLRKARVMGISEIRDDLNRPYTLLFS